MKPGRKGVQVFSSSIIIMLISFPITISEELNEKLSLVHQVLSSLAASLGQAACGHCVPVSAYMIPQVFKVLFHIGHI